LPLIEKILHRKRGTFIATEWSHPALRADIMGKTDLITYPTEIFTDGSKIGDKVGAGLAIFSEKRLVR